jgi:uncharacterized protein
MTITSGPCATLRTTVAAAALGVLFALTGFASAQEISPEHLKQARSAIAAIRATDQFDFILPQAADALKAELIQKDPNLEALITSTVDNEALTLVARRSDLENEAARVYAKVFTEAELKTIAEFYSTDVGKKLIADGPLAARQLVEAANIWQSGIGRDLAQNVADKIKAAAPSEPAPAEDAPADPAAGEKAPEAPKQ